MCNKQGGREQNNCPKLMMLAIVIVAVIGGLGLLSNMYDSMAKAAAKEKVINAEQRAAERQEIAQEVSKQVISEMNRRDGKYIGMEVAK